MKIAVEIEIDTDKLSGFSDEHLAVLWHVAQANPAGIEDQEAGQAAEHVGREIIRRWLADVPPQLWHHQGRHHYYTILQDHGKWLAVNGDENTRSWTPNPEATPSV